MLKSFLRQYEPDECGRDAYPFAWHRCTTCDGKGVTKGCGGPDWRETGVSTCSTCLGTKSIKDYVRIKAKNRCQRCGHPYRKGEHDNGEWSPCDEQCHHGGPVSWGISEIEGVTTIVDFNDEQARRIGETVILAQGLGEPKEHTVAWVNAQWRVLTVHHLTGVKSDCRWGNLSALCQRCHLSIQGRVKMDQVFPLEHSAWFKPHAAWWYAVSYLGEENPSREDVMSRLDELLALERMT